MFRYATILAIAVSVPLCAARAADGDNADMPETLIIGYDEEGKVDPSEASCRAFVTETVEWDKAETDQAVKDVCQHRQQHVDAYESIQSAYVIFRGVLQEQTRFEGAKAATSVAALVKNCIDFKWALSTGGHNIGIDMMPNAIATQCLDMGRAMIEKETSALGPAPSDPSGGE